MMKYKKCPKCELNYILENEDLCPVCKKTLQPALPEEDMDDTDNMCAVCGVRPAIMGGELCAVCIKERKEQEQRKQTDASGNFSDDDDDVTPEPSMEDIGINIINDNEIADEEVELEPIDDLGFDEEEKEYDDELWDD